MAFVKRSRRPGGCRIKAGGEGAGGGESTDGDGVDTGVGSATDCDISFTGQNPMPIVRRTSPVRIRRMPSPMA